MMPASNLLSSLQPLRISVLGPKGPLIVPLWFVWQDDRIWCASQGSSLVVRALQADPRCAYDVSTNDMPYRGIRGRGNARCLPEAGASVLEQLIDRYQVNRESQLSRWLLSRCDSEVAIEITPVWQTDWDYSERMAPQDVTREPAENSSNPR